MNVKTKLSLVLLAGLCAVSAARADVKLHRVFSHHMVLQREKEVNVWGWASPGEKVSVQFGGQSLSAVTDDKGKWSLKLIPNSGMAVTIDVGDAGDIYPRNKRDVGERLALWALAKDYGKPGLVHSGPLYQGMQIEGGRIRIAFDHIGGGLMVGKKDGLNPAVEDPGAQLRRFAIAGEDKQWFWADALIDGKTVVVSSPEVPAPVAVRYAYSMNPEGCNFYNKEGLPASPFRTDA